MSADSLKFVFIRLCIVEMEIGLCIDKSNISTFLKNKGVHIPQ